MIKKIGLALLAIVIAILAYAAVSPADYLISREIVINAPAEKIFPYLNSSKLAEQWAPWLEVDPGAKMTYSGPDVGVGSKTSWVSDGHLGTGSATIAESVPNDRVEVKLEYTKPMAMNQDSWYLLKPSGAQTTMTWKVTGKSAFPNRVVCLFMNMDKLVGSMFEKGLLNLKTLVEKQGK